MRPKRKHIAQTGERSRRKERKKNSARERRGGVGGGGWIANEREEKV